MQQPRIEHLFRTEIQFAKEEQTDNLVIKSVHAPEMDNGILTIRHYDESRDFFNMARIVMVSIKLEAV
jgi:hypothetical protein